MRRTGRREALFFGLLTVLVTICAGVYAHMMGEVNLNHQLVIAFSFVSLGMLIKYGDQAFDTDVFSRRSATVLAIPGGIWMGALILLDVDSATIFLGLLLALMVAAKYDNIAFKLGFLIAGGIGLYAAVIAPSPEMLVGMIAVFGAAFIDEKINDVDWVERGDTPAGWILRQRPVLKMTILLLCALSILSSYLYFFAFLGFDFGYSFIESLSKGGIGIGSRS
ncbi:MAG: hypothetical protein GKC03_05805 [Methanomassiliicoccales archaeon]|nr:hypothetical protein [Methanomassiliicoccales archaeon]NYT15573.1 hypothetical protein [Methanomassiliicoccales archaeon]